MYWLIYLNFACAVEPNPDTIDVMLRHGADNLYPQLQWADKVHMLDFCNRFGAPYKFKVFNKIVMDLLLADHASLVTDLHLNGLIHLIAHIKSIEMSVAPEAS